MAITDIDWDEPNTAALKTFLHDHVIAMQHCDETLDELGLCECMHRLAEWWTEQRAAPGDDLATLRAERADLLQQLVEKDERIAELEEEHGAMVRHVDQLLADNDRRVAPRAVAALRAALESALDAIAEVPDPSAWRGEWWDDEKAATAAAALAGAAPLRPVDPTDAAGVWERAAWYWTDCYAREAAKRRGLERDAVRMGAAIALAVHTKLLDSRSPAADAMLDYCNGTPMSVERAREVLFR